MTTGGEFDQLFKFKGVVAVVATLQTSSIFGTSEVVFAKMIDGTKILGKPIFIKFGWREFNLILEEGIR